MTKNLGNILETSNDRDFFFLNKMKNQDQKYDEQNF